MIAGLHFVRKRRAGRPIKWYVYAYRGGPQIMKAEGPRKPRLSSEALTAFASAQAQLERHPPDTLAHLVREWWPSSPEWTGLSGTTRKTWGSALKAIEGKWGATPLTVWSDARMVAKVVAWRDSRAETPRAADIGVTVLRALLEFGRMRGRVAINVAAGIRQLYKNGSRAEIIWSDTDIEKFVDEAAELECPHIADGLRLAATTGLRREDLVTLTWDQVTDFAVVKKAMKKSRGKRRFVTIPRTPALDEVLADLRSRPRDTGVHTVLVNSLGRSWSPDGFGGSFNRVRDAACIVHVDPETGSGIKKHLHDLRGTFCTKLLAMGLSDSEVADIMGWSPQQVAGIRRCYVDRSAVVVAIGRRIQQGL